MAGPPRLTYDGENRPKVKASLSGGRFHFTLRDDARRLLVETLSYSQGEEVPWQLFKILVLAGDANFPNTQDELDLAEDLVEPDPHRKPTDEEARALASHLEEKALSDRQLSVLVTELTVFGLDSHVDFDRIGSGSNADDGTDADDRQEAAVESDAGSAVSTSGSAGSAESGSGTTEPAATGQDAGTATESATAESEAADSAAPEPAAEAIDDPLIQTMMLLSERLVRTSGSFESLSNEEVIDLYTLLSEVQSVGGDRRTEARDVLVERIREDTRLEGSIGTIERKTRRRKSLKDEHEIFDVLADAGVGHTEVMSVELDKKKLETVAEERNIPEEALFDIEESGYVRRVSTDDEKRRAAFERMQRSG